MSVKEKRLEAPYIAASYAELELIINLNTGFVNETHFLRSKGPCVRRYKKSLSAEIVQTFKRYYLRLHYPGTRPTGIVAGTYLHPALLLDAAIWLSPECYIYSAIVIANVFSKSDLRQQKLFELLACKESPVCEHINPNWWIRYRDLHLEVDQRGWFKATDFCAANHKKLNDFQEQQPEEIVKLLAYARTKGWSDGVFYHPLLFLRLASWVSTKLYVKTLRVVFCCGVKQLDTLFREAIATAATEPRSSETAPQPVKPAKMLTRSEHEMEMARLRLRLESEVNRERREKDSVRAELRRVEQEKLAAIQRERQKDEELEALRLRLENLEVCDEHQRMTLRKRPSPGIAPGLPPGPPPDAEANVAKMRTLLLYSTADGSVVPYRRQFQLLVRAIHQDLHKIHSFVGWFICVDPIDELNRCKVQLKKWAAETHRNLTLLSNMVKLNDEADSGELDLPEVMCSIFRTQMGNVELDAWVLGQLFDRPACKYDAATRNPEDEALAERVYTWMKEQHAQVTKLKEGRNPFVGAWVRKEQ